MSEGKEHNGNAQRLKKLEEESNYQKQESLAITKEMVSKQSRKILNLEAPRGDGDQGFWIKKLTSFHKRTVFQMNKILNGNEQLPQWANGFVSKRSSKG